MFENDIIEILLIINEGLKGYNYFKVEFRISNKVSNEEFG